MTEEQHAAYKAAIEHAEAELAERVAEYQAACDHPDYVQTGYHYQGGIRRCFDCQLRVRFEYPGGNWGELADRRGRRRVDTHGRLE